MVEDLAPLFSDFAVAGLLAGTAVSGILNAEDFDEGPGAITRSTSYLLKPGAAVTPAVGQQLVVQGTTYTVRQVLREPPDGVLTRLVLARA